VNTAQKAGKRAIWLANGLVDVTVVVIVLVLLAFGGYAFWDSRQVVMAADASRYQVYKPTGEGSQLSFAELQAINPDVFAWLTVYGTHIDYPVVQGPNNTKYVSTNAEGRYSLSGAIFLDAYQKRDFTSFPSILYGHHMEQAAMLGEEGLFADKAYFEARRYGMLYFDGKEHGLEFFAFVHADAYDRKVFRTSISRSEDREAFLTMINDIATHTRDVDVGPDDRVVLLSTCSDGTTNGRDILAARISDEVFADPFATGPGDDQAEAGLSSWWSNMPLWARAGLIAAAILAALILLLTLRQAKNRRQQRRANSEVES